MQTAEPCRYTPIVALDHDGGGRAGPFAIEVQVQREAHVKLACAVGALLAAHQAHPDRRPPAVMVSLGTDEIERLDLSSLTSSLVAAGVPADLLMIRIPHYAAGSRTPVLDRLVATGVTVVVANLTVSHGELERLAGAPVDVVELPPALVDEVDRSAEGREGVEAWMQLAHRVDWLVLARNVRRPSQAAALERLGCDLAAGPLMGAPVDLPGLGAPRDPRSSRLAG